MTAAIRSRLLFAVGAVIASALVLGLTAGPTYALDSTYTAKVCIQDSGGNPLTPGTTHYQLNGGPELGFSSTLAGDCLTQDFTVSGSANLTVWTSYNHTTSAHVQHNLAETREFVFQTEKVTVRLEDASHGGVAGGTVRYGTASPTTYYFPGTTTPASGELSAELFPGTYQFSVGLNQTSKAMTQDVATDSTVVFTTTAVTLGYSGTIAFGGSGSTAWFKQTAGSTPATRQMFPGTVNFRFDFSGGPVVVPITVDSTALTESMIVARLLDSASSPVAGAPVQYDSGGGLETLGTTDTNGIAYLLVDGLLDSVTVALPDNGDLTLTQNQPGNSIYVFQNVTTNEPPVADPGGPYLFPLSAGPFDGSLSSDPDGDTLTYAWTFGDGGTDTDAQPSHTYAEAGIYTVCLTVNDGQVDSKPVCTQAVVYDPSAGFVTGGGWIDSPVGAYRADPTLTGKATFGFVARYKKGANVPDGSTEFVFHAGNLNFHSTSYDWLVVAGTDAKFKGEGTVNGVDGYTFQINGDDGSPDTFRIQIWSPGGGILYDNGSQQEIGGGSIIVHN